MKGNDVYRHGKSQFSKDTSSYTEETLRLHHEFFDRIIAEFNLQKTDGDIMAVLHILPDAVPFTAGLKRIGNINMIIPKPKSINQESLETLSELPVKHLTRDDIRMSSLM